MNHSIVSFDPFHRLDRDFRTLLNFPFFARENEEFFAPAVDVRETDKEYQIKAELPGLEKDQVKLAFDEGVLTISGERREQKEEKSARTHRIECAYGEFSRSIQLPGGVDTAKISAEMKSGVLTVHCPKSGNANLRQIAIN
jgi:HSP20 family protein